MMPSEPSPSPAADGHRSGRRPLRAGIIGVGMVGSIHARSARLAGAELAGVSAATPATSQEAAGRLGADRGFDDPRALVEDPGVDVVHICTPNDLHFELAGAALAAGKHVVCEKPLAIDLEQARELQDLAAAAGVVATVPFVYRFYPMVREARALVAAGQLGALKLLGGAYLQDWLLPAATSNWRVDPRRGGPSRAFADIGSHWCDLVEFVGGERIVALSAQMRTLQEERPRAAQGAHSFAPPDPRADGEWLPVETEDLAVVSFRTASDAVGAMLVSQVSAGHKNGLSFELTGTLGTLRFDGRRPDSLVVAEADSVRILERDHERLHATARPYSTLPPGHPQGYHDAFDAFVADTYAAITAAAPPVGLPTFADGVRAVALTDAALRSAAAGGGWSEVVAVSEAETRGGDF